ncbi:hypothetical protein [Cellulomonas rhizosphaerae]|uniref:Uncharacterized protein n=1 Tax=Cellulomonas rhizosphaerae TaxID=2293719 RepID=A0A413RN66_9CELL|nr:hypothetical protein [Cellulomonas rhizosphaerae]RHA43135.1 hypothetical protein D1825_06250 [Cellulomonas rhizosphaerae]
MVGELVWRHVPWPGAGDEWSRPFCEAIARSLARSVGSEGLGRHERRTVRNLWAHEVLWMTSAEGNLPLEVLDVVVHHEDASDALIASMGIGVVETLLREHPGRYVEGLAVRARTDDVWREVLRCVSLDDDDAWAALPPELGALVLGPAPTSEPAKAPQPKMSRVSSRRRG